MDLQSHRFISSFEPEQALELCDLAVLVNLPSKTVIFEEGEIPDCLYLVLDGQVEFRKLISFDKYQTIALAKANDFFGEFGILDGQPRSAQAIVCKDATLAGIPRDRLMEILDNTKGSIVLNLFRYVIEHMRSTTAQYVNQMVHKEKMSLVGEMVNTIIHDFKSPVTGIHLASAMVKELHPDEETTEWCDLIQAQVQRMLVMTEELLEFGRGSSTLQKQPVNLSLLLQRFEKLNSVYLKTSHLQFIVHASEVIVNGDENKLMRVLQNLVGNAVEALKNRGGKVEIVVWESNKGGEIKISDNGPGIPEEIRDRLFEPFVTHGKQGGSGLGTAISKSIIDAHGGRISFQSNCKEGTTFHIILPLFKGEYSK